MTPPGLMGLGKKEEARRANGEKGIYEPLYMDFEKLRALVVGLERIPGLPAGAGLGSNPEKRQQTCQNPINRSIIC